MSSAFFPLEIQELRRFSSVYTIFVKWFTSIKDIKDLIHQRSNVAPSKMHLFHTSSSKALSNQSTLHDLGIYQAGHVLRLVLNIVADNQNALITSKDMEVDDNCLNMLSEVQLGLDHGKFPGKTDMLDCTGGVYFMKSASGHQVSVFKPSDEEQGMPNNPKGHAGNGDTGLRAFFKPGQGYIRETAAYILDYNNFCRVPPTTIVHCEHPTFHYPSAIGTSKTTFPKIGSMQKFIRASDTFEDISPSVVSTLELQKIALLDMRLLNCDRNASNILAIRKLVSNNNNNPTMRRDSRSSSMGSYGSEDFSEDLEFNPFADDFGNGKSNSSDSFELVPIDHGYCVPTKLCIDEIDWVWFYCPHISREVDPEIRRYLLSLDIDSLLSTLSSQLSLSDDCLFLLKLSHKLLCEGVEAGLTLRDIAELIARTAEDVCSPLENVITAAEDNAHRAIEMRTSRLSYNHTANISSSSSTSTVTPQCVELKTPPLRKNVSLMKFTNTASDFNMTKSLKVSTSTDLTTSSPVGSPKKRNKVYKATESEPILDSYEHEADREHAENEELELRNLRLSNLVTDQTSLIQLTRKISLDFSHPSFKETDSSAVNNNNNNNSNKDEYFVSDLSALQDNNNDNTNTSVKVGLNVPNFKYMQGKPLTSLQSVDSSFTHIVTAVETTLPTRNNNNYNINHNINNNNKYNKNNDNNNNYSINNNNNNKPTTSETRMDFSDQDITSSECGSSPNSQGDHFFLASRLKFQASASNSLEFDNNNINNNKLHSCVPFQSNNNDKNEECRSSCDEELISTLNNKNNNSNLERIRTEPTSASKAITNTTTSLDRKSPDLSDDASSLMIMPPVKLARVISLGAFASPPIYDIDKAERQVTRLRRDKRRNTAKTNEFQELRLTFALEAIKAIISKEKKLKNRSAVLSR